MNKREGIVFLFTIAKEIQNSFVSPVILFTHKDYAEGIFSTFVNIRQALLEQASPERITEIVFAFHMKWLEAIQEIELFKKRIKETPHEVILQLIDYSIDYTKHRYNDLSKYIDEIQSSMTYEETRLIHIDLLNIKEMQNIANSALLEKKAYLCAQADQTEYHARIADEIEELMYWLDRLNDNLAIELCKVLNFKVPLAACDLTKTLKEMIDEVASDPAPEAQGIAELIHVRGEVLGSAIRINSLNDLEIAKVIEKIRALEDRINRLQNQNSSALIALKHKTMFLEERLQSLENIKMSLWKLKEGKHEDTSETAGDHNMHIFNHLLPHPDRCRLVEKLIKLWKSALVEHDHESIISILSVADLKEIFYDDAGNFIVDKHGRKLYSKTDDNELYQLNERNELVPVRDDDKHVYFYDLCGRYYINESRNRVYKDHEDADEYMFNNTGDLVKVQEKVGDVVYHYDWLGRYYFDEKGRQIYCEENSDECYEHDGLGNLVKIHKKSLSCKPCPIEFTMTQDENKYLKRVVGDALKKCITDVILLQPSDPVGYLSDCLKKYSNTIKEREKHIQDEEERLELSRLIHTTKENSPESFSDDEATYDLNFVTYAHDENSLQSSY